MLTMSQALRRIKGNLAAAVPETLLHALCRDVLVSDGFRHHLYAANQDYQPVAYANLIRPKRSALDLFNRLKRPGGD
jgi:hypothetical protein